MPEIKIKKTRWDKIVDVLHVLSSGAMVIVIVFLAIFAYKQWDAAEQRTFDPEEKQTIPLPKFSLISNWQLLSNASAMRLTAKWL